MTLLYLHGFNSAPQSHKAQVLKRHLEARGLGDRFACPKLPHRPCEAIACAEREIALRPADTVTLVGSSLGGFYATYLAEKHGLRAVLLNPAVTPQLDLESYLGTQRNLYTGEAYELTRDAHRRVALPRYAVDSPGALSAASSRPATKSSITASRCESTPARGRSWSKVAITR